MNKNDAFLVETIARSVKEASASNARRDSSNQTKIPYRSDASPLASQVKYWVKMIYAYLVQRTARSAKKVCA